MFAKHFWEMKKFDNVNKDLYVLGFGLLSRLIPLSQTWKKLIFVRNPIFGIEKCPQIQIVPKHMKVPKISNFWSESSSITRTGTD